MLIRSNLRLGLLVSTLALAPACSGAAEPTAASPTSSVVATGGDKLACPEPIGSVPREDCSAVADDFGALSVAESLKLAGSGRDADARIEAIRAAAALANVLKEQRVSLCELYDKCKVTPADHAAKDKVLTGSMRALIDLWNQRRFSGTDAVVRFRESVRALDQKVNSDAVAAPGPPKSLTAAQALAQVEGAGLAFKVDGTAIVVTAQGEGSRVALRTRPEALPLASGHHYRLKVSGSYAPAAAALIAPGDELTVRLKFRADQAGDLYAALRSLEDPDAGESTTTWHVTAGEKGAREAAITADPTSSGFYVGVGITGAGGVDLDDVEILRGGKVIAAGRAESDAEAGVKSECLVIGVGALGGQKSWRCKAGAGDRVVVGRPDSHLFLTLRGPLGDRAVLRTLSLDGGRSVDATVSEDAELVIGLVGAGTATIRSVETTELSQ
ncbi:MAG: hypothetical protein ABJE95_16015 [Byssovorax sp.]